MIHTEICRAHTHSRSIFWFIIVQNPEYKDEVKGSDEAFQRIVFWCRYIIASNVGGQLWQYGWLSSGIRQQTVDKLCLTLLPHNIMKMTKNPSKHPLWNASKLYRKFWQNVERQNKLLRFTVLHSHKPLKHSHSRLHCSTSKIISYHLPYIWAKSTRPKG